MSWPGAKLSFRIPRERDDDTTTHGYKVLGISLEQRVLRHGCLARTKGNGGFLASSGFGFGPTLGWSLRPSERCYPFKGENDRASEL